MKKIFPLLALLLVILTACPRKDKELDVKKPVVTQFIYDGMDAFYLWRDGMIDKKPTLTAENDPTAYFKSLLSSVDTKNGWSQITDDVDALLADFAGTPLGFGWSLALYGSNSNNSVVVYVKYVFPNTPAASAGIVRGQVIYSIDGVTINRDNYLKLFGGNALNVGLLNPSSSATRVVAVTPVVIQTNPVLKDTIYKDRPEFAGKKIGYLFYTDFIAEYNNKLYETFTKFKAEGITDLVLDLRYNHGGAIAAARYLASLIAPRAVVQDASVFSMYTFNSLLSSEQTRSRVRFQNLAEGGVPNPLNANINLNTVYILATDDSYSAAELLTFCLKPYMNVRHIGTNTGGKYTGSVTLHAYDDYNDEAIAIYDANDLNAENKAVLRNWAMQPIVLKYADRDGKDFENPGYLAPTDPVVSIEDDPSLWKPIAVTNDYLLAKAISLITGLPVQSSNLAAALNRSVYGTKKVKLFSPKDNILKESVRFDKAIGKEVRNKVINAIKAKHAALNEN